MAADIQEIILSRYGIDIAKENIFKLYKIDKPDITPQELDIKIQDTRKRWNQSINGANEKNAIRDKERMDKADQYEAILKDDRLRKELFAYYNGTGAKGGKEGGTGGSVDFAREYFKLLETSKKIRQDDVKFFFEYYQAERKNKKAILEMLEKEFKVKKLGKDEKYADEEAEKEVEGKTKDESSSLIVNLFQEATIMKLQKCFAFYEKAVASNDVCQKFPALKAGMLEFLKIDEAKDCKSYAGEIAVMQKDAYAVRQERGNEYIPLVDLLNTMHTLLSYRDVVDNFDEFKLLVHYPNLTPYMYSFTEMKPDTLKGIIKVANREYVFRDDADFIVNYYNPVHDNFGITNNGIRSIIKKAEKRAKANKVLDKIDEKIGRQQLSKLPLVANLLHWIAYWPIFVVFLVFEVFKILFESLKKTVIPVTALFFIGLNWLLPKCTELDNMTVLFKIIEKKEWQEYLQSFSGYEMTADSPYVVLSIVVILIMLLIYVVPSVFVCIFTKNMTNKLSKEIDWKGYERTLQGILKNLHDKTEKQFAEKKNAFVKNQIIMGILNILYVAVIVLTIIFIPKGFQWFSETTGYFQPSEEVSEVITSEENISEELSEEVSEEPEILMVITASSANIRAGVGTSYDVVATGVQGETFVATGNQETTSSGNVWYEIYLDEEKTKTGWASQKVIEILEQEEE
ncbi:MAG: SH3 domain-containing protein [Lachnospiraceae bacterium]|nr:SH3 domain-containing protein [Lachnospiraceae bacterium]